MKLPSDIVVGQYLQLIALCIAAAIAATYALGYTLGRAIHNMNATITDFIRLERDDKVALLQLTIEELYRIGTAQVRTSFS